MMNECQPLEQEPPLCIPERGCGSWMFLHRRVLPWHPEAGGRKRESRAKEKKPKKKRNKKQCRKKRKDKLKIPKYFE
jgi:hypothetical protein